MSVIGFLVTSILGGLLCMGGFGTLIGAMWFGSQHRSDYIGSALVFLVGSALTWYAMRNSPFTISFDTASVLPLVRTVVQC